MPAPALIIPFLRVISSSPEMFSSFISGGKYTNIHVSVELWKCVCLKPANSRRDNWQGISGSVPVTCGPRVRLSFQATAAEEVSEQWSLRPSRINKNLMGFLGLLIFLTSLNMYSFNSSLVLCVFPLLFILPHESLIIVFISFPINLTLQDFN